MRKVDESKFLEVGESACEVLEGLVKKRNKPTPLPEYDWAKEHMRRKRAGEVKESYDFNRYSKTPVKLALERLFHGKCAYCESFFARTQPVDVEHYRPKNKIDFEPNHEGYWWLAMEWKNLLPSCIDCNRVRSHAFEFDPTHDLNTLRDLIGAKFKSENAGKGNLFPLSPGTPRAEFDWTNETRPDMTSEHPLLINPVETDPADHLEFQVGDLSLVTAKKRPDGTPSPEGICSIAIYGLNRIELVQARTRLLRDLELLLDAMTKVITAYQDLEKDFINPRKTKLQTLTGAQRAKIQNEITKLERIAASLRSVEASIRLRFKELGKPEAEYSTLVKAWADNLSVEE